MTKLLSALCVLVPTCFAGDLAQLDREDNFTVLSLRPVEPAKKIDVHPGDPSHEKVSIYMEGVPYYDERKTDFEHAFLTNAAKTIYVVNMKPAVEVCIPYVVLRDSTGIHALAQINTRVGRLFPKSFMRFNPEYVMVERIDGNTLKLFSKTYGMDQTATSCYCDISVSSAGDIKLLHYE